MLSSTPSAARKVQVVREKVTSLGSVSSASLAMSKAPYNSRFERLMLQVTAAGSAL